MQPFGSTGGDRLEFKTWAERWDEATTSSVSLADLRAAHEGFFPALMQGEL
jgi:hypothetical protein